MESEPARPDEGREVPSRPVGMFLVGFLGLCVPSLALTALGILHFGARGVKQPIDFNHQKHVVDLGLSCDTCHSSYEKEAFSGLPKAEDCAACHAEAQGSTEKERLLVEMLKREEPLEWRRLYAQPAHVFYSHRRHVKVAQLDCAACHGRFAETTSPPRKVHQLTMSDCIGCHQKTNVSVACTTCHR